MKKLLLFAAFAVFATTFSFAQEVRLGAKAGVNFASIGGDETDDVDGRTSFHIGGVVEIPISEVFSVQPELLYSSQGAKEEYSEDFLGETISAKAEMKLDYINIPILAKYYVAEGFSIEAGPQVGFLVSANGEYEVSGGGQSESEEEDISDFVSGVDFGIGAGVGYRLPMGVFFQARYTLGLSNINDGEGSDDFKNQNNVIQLSVGYSF
ncbi:porin family protein [Marixanthomonas spongiae]|uniref:PorT family protein n=1 Tax=Marixanthomonas spongiae TaxID=2174845 RepID=A0A2U0I3P3_9FLAO|nr:porin family protein [Marixanthomonas spongiae]PVW15684.1 PorT family protein [Marixanthomonas spongiae]